MQRRILLLTIAALLLLSGCGSSQPVEKTTTTAELTQLEQKTAKEVIVDRLPGPVFNFIDKFSTGDPWISLSEKDGVLDTEVVIKQEIALPFVADKVLSVLQEYANEQDLGYSLRVVYVSAKKDVVTWSIDASQKKGLYVNSKDGTTEKITLDDLYEKYDNFGKED